MLEPLAVEAPAAVLLQLAAGPGFGDPGSVTEAEVTRARRPIAAGGECTPASGSGSGAGCRSESRAPPSLQGAGNVSLIAIFWGLEARGGCGCLDEGEGQRAEEGPAVLVVALDSDGLVPLCRRPRPLLLCDDPESMTTGDFATSAAGTCPCG